MTVTRVSEAAEMAALFAWARAFEIRHPALALMFHPANEGKRAPWKAIPMGLKAGVPDVMLPVARHGSIGLAIEMKAGNGRLSEAQAGWLSCLTREGWATHVHASARPGDWTRAAAIVAEYLDMPPDTIPTE